VNGKLESVASPASQLNLFQVAAATGKKHTLDFLLNELTTQDSAGTIKALPKQLLLGNPIQAEEATILFLALCQRHFNVFFYLWGEIGRFFGSDALLKVASFLVLEALQDLLPQFLEMKVTKQHFAAAHPEIRTEFSKILSMNALHQEEPKAKILSLLAQGPYNQLAASKGRRAQVLFQAINKDDLKTVKKEEQELGGYELSFEDVGADED